jgi:hypothetical protein
MNTDKGLDWIEEEQWKNMNEILLFPGTAAEFEAAAERLAHRFPMFCKWCLAEGNHTQTGWGPKRGMTAICERHNDAQKEEIRQRFPEAGRM